ncbi:hypothetical protein Aple_038190 [Acrocarpospora pleiomorpha]|uniref:Uncharacterized protein n=1 Tax=Acrocarpospora pleiomorpha TaxID=90975 RepID=A0A5M3XP49_9ACTN|nr:hypothetical protein Aple_038190 [Acrocarpospora pleiomorpha]
MGATPVRAMPGPESDTTPWAGPGSAAMAVGAMPESDTTPWAGPGLGAMAVGVRGPSDSGQRLVV